jgi:predicted TIM-barrel fold metal-dependent hydrolase
MSVLDYLAYDADNHYYEGLDAFTRHLDPKMASRCVQWADIEGRKYHVVGGRVSHAVKNATFDPIAMPGALSSYFRGNPDGKSPLELMRAREPIPEAYRTAAGRLKVMDEQGLEAMWVFPTLGILYEELLKDDVEAVTATFAAFNRWLEDDWGFATEGRVFGAPYVTLADPDFACRELEWMLERGAQVLCMRPAAIWTRSGPVSPANEMFDPFWARVNEAGITMVVHAGDSGYTTHGYTRDGFGASFDGAGWRPSIKAFNIERAAYDFLITVAYEKLFERFPNLRMASVENGSEFLPDLFRKLRQSAARMPGYYKEDPCESFREHVWMNPFWEDDVNEVVEMMGADRVIFGSDWPHIEGMPKPLDYVEELSAFDGPTCRKILRENTEGLTRLRPA